MPDGIPSETNKINYDLLIPAADVTVLYMCYQFHMYTLMLKEAI